MRKQIRCLRLREGDIVLVRDHQALEALMQAGKGMKGIPNCPIVVAPEGVHRLSKKYVARLVSTESPVAGTAGNVEE